MSENTTYNINEAAELLTGRLPIYTSIERFDPSEPERIVAEVNEALSIKARNDMAMNLLYWYRRGVAPIYGREKSARAEINNKVHVNHAEEIVSFKNGWFLPKNYTFYIARKEGRGLSRKVEKLNEYLYRSGKQRADSKVVDWFHTVGKGNIFIQANDDKDVPYKVYCIDPRNAFVVKSMMPGNRTVYAGNTVIQGDRLVIDIWDDTNVYKLEGTFKGEVTTPYPNYIATATRVVDIKPNPLKRVPILEYYYNSVYMGAYEQVYGLLNAIDALQSDRLDGVDQFIQSLLVFYNCELGDDEDGNPITPKLIRDMGAVFLKSIGENKADLKEIASQLDQSQTQVFIDNLYDEILSICGMPMTDRRGSSNHATGSVALIDNGFYQADTVARNTEDLFLETNAEFDEIMTSILREKGLLDISPVEFKLQIPRNETFNVQSKAQSFQTLLASGMHPELAAAKSGISSDPVADMKMSEPWLTMIWGDPFAPKEDDFAAETPQGVELPEGAEAANRATPAAPAKASSAADDRLARNGLPTNAGTSGVVRTYTQYRNGRKVTISGYSRSKRQDVQ